MEPSNSHLTEVVWFVDLVLQGNLLVTGVCVLLEILLYAL
jgi:hypothetical protein